MLDLLIVLGARSLPIHDLPAALGRNKAAREVADTIDGMIAFLDDLGGDPDLEDSEASDTWVDDRGRYIGDVRTLPAHDFDGSEPGGDEADASFPEWRSDGHRRIAREALQHEDAEDDDSDRCVAGDDHMTGGPVANRDWWRPSAMDIGDAEDAEDGHDAEFDQDGI